MSREVNWVHGDGRNEATRHVERPVVALSLIQTVLIIVQYFECTYQATTDLYPQLIQKCGHREGTWFVISSSPSGQPMNQSRASQIKLIKGTRRI